MAATGTTSSITVRGNELKDNFWNGLLVFSAGAFVHDSWTVTGNTVADNGFVGIELTNAENSEITDNTLDDNGFAGIVVQARNTIPDSGERGIESLLVARNTVSGSPRGIYLLALASGPLDPFPPIVGAQSRLSVVNVHDNTVSEATDGILVIGFEGGTITEVNVHHNTVTASNIGIRVTTFGTPGSADDNEIHHNGVTSTGTNAITLETGTSDNKVHHNSLLATSSVTGDDAVGEGGTGNRIFRNA